MKVGLSSCTYPTAPGCSVCGSGDPSLGRISFQPRAVVILKGLTGSQDQASVAQGGGLPLPLPRDPFTRAAFGRRQRLAYDEAGHSGMFIASEDIIVAKLVAHRETESDKHLLDAQGVLVIQWGGLDLDLVRRRAGVAGVMERFERLLAVAREEIEE